MRYIVVASANGRSFHLAKQKIGSEAYTTIATFTNEDTAKKTAAVMNADDQKPKARIRTLKEKP
jgi:hypothetical protein